MIRTVLVFLAAISLSASPASALTEPDITALKRLTKDYASWDYSGRPVEFRQRLDYKSYEEQRRILLKLAEIEWNGIWGDYWRRLGVSDLKTLRAFSPKDFWVRFHSVLKPRDAAHKGAGAGRVSVDVHAIAEARGVAYVIYQVSYSGRDFPSEDNLEVLRARWSDGEWRMVSLPRVTAGLRRQLDAAQTKRRTGR